MNSLKLSNLSDEDFFLMAKFNIIRLSDQTLGTLMTWKENENRAMPTTRLTQRTPFETEISGKRS